MEKENVLEGTRGLAAFIVMVSHFIVAFYPSLYNGSADTLKFASEIEITIAKSPVSIFYNGHLSVCIFFILSGYVLSYKFFKYKDDKIIVSSALRRYFRLMLPVLFSVFSAYIILKANLFYNLEAAKISGSDWWLGTFYTFDANFIQMINEGAYKVFFMNQCSYNPVLWTMHYELFGSFFVFGFLSLFGQLKRRYILYLIALLLTLNTYYLAFVLGMLLCDFTHYNHSLFNFLHNSKIFYILFVIGFIFASYPTAVDIQGSFYGLLQLNFITNLISFYHIIGGFFLIVSILNISTFKKIFSHKIFLFLGKISFSMYFIHFVILCSFSCFLFLKLIVYFSYSISFLLTFFISVICIIFISYFLTKYIDIPAIRFSKWFYKRYFE